VNNVNVTNIHNVYNKTVINNTTINHVSYNGGNGGISPPNCSGRDCVTRATPAANGRSKPSMCTLPVPTTNFWHP
jgi:hypothetical protein